MWFICPGKREIPMEVVCACCGRVFIRSPRNKNQCYCSKPKCQRKRKSLWQKSKMATDENYRLNHKASQQEWIRNNPGYWEEYRKKKPDKAKRNRELQIIRNRRKRNPSLIAKMDASGTRHFQPLGKFYLVPMIAKMDALIVSMFRDNNELSVIAKKDSIAGCASLI
jgi:hypothetical protein